MHIKPQTVIPAHIKITRLPPSNKVVRSLYSLEKAHERQLEKQGDSKQLMENFKQARAAGLSVAEAALLITFKR